MSQFGDLSTGISLVLFLGFSCHHLEGAAGSSLGSRCCAAGEAAARARAQSADEWPSLMPVPREEMRNILYRRSKLPF